MKRKITSIFISVAGFSLLLMGCNTPTSTPTDTDTHQHTFENKYSFDENYHWKASTCGHDVKEDYEPHNFVLHEEEGFYYNECDKCGYKYDVKPNTINGYVSYEKATSEEKSKILGALEKYLVNTNLAGIPLYGDGNFVMFADGVNKGSDKYIPNYGFGALEEGTITSDLLGEDNHNYKRYWHTYEIDDPKTVLYFKDKGSVVSNIASYISASFFDKKMNESKDGYEWYGVLSNYDRPLAINPDENGFSTTFKFPVKVGSELKYSTSTSVSRLVKYNNQEVKLEDYITTFQIYYTSAFLLARSTENLIGKTSIKGAKEYYEASKDGINLEAWEKVGIKAYQENDKSYLEFTFNEMVDTYTAMNYLSQKMFAPVPKDFILDLGGENNSDMLKGVKLWGSFSEDDSETPLDHFLCTGPYEIEEYNKNESVIFKKNHNSIYENRYQIAGISCLFLKEAKTDLNAAFKAFLQNKLSSVIIPSDYISNYRNDPRTSTTSNSGVYRLNLNTCDIEMWESLFGENGSITKTNKRNYWKVKPIMSVSEFIKGISYSMNRNKIASDHNKTIGYTLLGDNYMVDPEYGVSYNSTDSHLEAIKSMTDGTDGYGYSLELAKQSFSKAKQILLENGSYSKGEVIHIEIAWSNESQANEFKDIGKYIEDAFNSSEGDLTLKVDNYVPKVWSDIYFKKMMVGQFDIGFGSISGSAINFDTFPFESLRSDNKTGFTLNWGKDTSEITTDIVYNNYCWSYNGLLTALFEGAYFDYGVVVDNFIEVQDVKVSRNANSDLLIEIYAEEKHFDDKNYGKVIRATLFAYIKDNVDTYEEIEFPLYNENGEFVKGAGYNNDKKCYVMEISRDIVSSWITKFPQDSSLVQGVDLYGMKVLNGKDVSEMGGYLGTFWTGLIPE